jgi:hypothetical protein
MNITTTIYVLLVYLTMPFSYREYILLKGMMNINKEFERI